MLQDDSARNRLTGIGLVSSTYILFSLLDCSAKWLVGSMPVIMVVWLRFATQVVIAGAALLPLRGFSFLKTKHLRWHEKLDAGRWIAIVAGFAGVLVIVHPWSAEFHPAMLASVVNAVLYACFMMMTRRLAAYDSPETIQYLPAVGATLGLAPFAFAAWEAPDGWLEWTVACLLGVLIVIGSGPYLFTRERARR